MTWAKKGANHMPVKKVAFVFALVVHSGLSMAWNQPGSRDYTPPEQEAVWAGMATGSDRYQRQQNIRVYPNGGFSVNGHPCFPGKPMDLVCTSYIDIAYEMASNKPEFEKAWGVISQKKAEQQKKRADALLAKVTPIIEAKYKDFVEGNEFTAENGEVFRMYYSEKVANSVYKKTVGNGADDIYTVYTADCKTRNIYVTEAFTYKYSVGNYSNKKTLVNVPPSQSKSMVDNLCEKI
jgi:hypothetical protein